MNNLRPVVFLVFVDYSCCLFLSLDNDVWERRNVFHYNNICYLNTVGFRANITYGPSKKC